MKNWFLILFVSLLSPTAWSYPEYAVRNNVMRCTACHISPVGGGPKTVYGKLYGAHGYKLNPILQQDHVGADLRMLFYYPQHPSESKGGTGIMAGSVYGHVALDEDKRVEVVLEHNVAGFSAAPYRDTYVLFHLSPDDGQPHWFETLLVGRFRPPFGIIADEHRTYTRVQTATEFFTFDTGMMLSGTPAETVHYDLALVNGDRAAGGSLTAGQAERYGGTLNIRYMPGPFMVGLSGTHYDRIPHTDNRQAASLYSVISLGRWTGDRVPLSIRLEHVRARNFDDHLGQGFATDSNYVTSLKYGNSQGWLAGLDYAVNMRFSLIYKYDRLTPDRDYPSDFYERHGFGIRYVVAPETLIQLRTEIAKATPPSEGAETGSAAQNATYGVLQVSF